MNEIKENYRDIFREKIKTVEDLRLKIDKLPSNMKVYYVDWKGDTVKLGVGDVMVRKTTLSPTSEDYLCLGTYLAEK